jgi:hypothetical protein
MRGTKNEPSSPSTRGLGSTTHFSASTRLADHFKLPLAVIPIGRTGSIARPRLVDLRQNRENPRRKSRSTFWFGKGRDDNRTRLGHLVEVCEQLDLVMIMAQNITLVPADRYAFPIGRRGKFPDVKRRPFIDSIKSQE